ncbi:MAG: hypothetical protein ABIP63_01015, partial [Thermoanaerobaculia bacterium]
MFRTLALASLLTALSVPLLAQTPCDLEITLSCATGTCKSVTKNIGANACAGEYIFGFYSESPAAKFTNFSNSLGATECFDSSTFPGEQNSFALCVATTTLAAGASFSTSTQVTGLPPASANNFFVALTLVIDPVTEDELAFVYAFDTPDQVTCTPRANVPSLTLSGVPYSVSWTPVSDSTATYLVDESTTPDFSANVSTKPASGTSLQFLHTVGTTTTYYYRVRAVSCNGSPGANSAPVSIVVQSAPPQTSRGADAPVPLGTTTPVNIPLTLTIKSSGKRALADTTFAATTDKPYLTV